MAMFVKLYNIIRLYNIKRKRYNVKRKTYNVSRKRWACVSRPTV